jgi:hypothetical protein
MLHCQEESEASRKISQATQAGAFLATKRNRQLGAKQRKQQRRPGLSGGASAEEILFLGQ